MKFGLLGDGRIAAKHRQAIKDTGHELIKVHDPCNTWSCCPEGPPEEFWEHLDYVSICSPTPCHYPQIKEALRNDVKVIVEKPMVLPWEPIIDDDRISMVLQLRHIGLHKANRIKVTAVRDADYYRNRGSTLATTGGVWFELFIHYVDLALFLGATCECSLLPEGEQERRVDRLNLFDMDQSVLYAAMYTDILDFNAGVTPYEVARLYWLLNKYSAMYGSDQEMMNKTVKLQPTSTMLERSIRG